MRSRIGRLRKNDDGSEEIVNIKKTTAFAIVMGAMIVGTANAQKPETFNEAKALSTRQNKPLLLEFFSEG